MTLRHRVRGQGSVCGSKAIVTDNELQCNAMSLNKTLFKVSLSITQRTSTAKFYELAYSSMGFTEPIPKLVQACITLCNLE